VRLRLSLPAPGAAASHLRRLFRLGETKNFRGTLDMMPNDNSNSDGNSSTPQIDAILRDLAEMCTASIRDDEPFDDERAQQLVESLKINGWDRHSNKQKPLRDQIRDRVFKALPENTHPRRSELDGLLNRIQGLYGATNQFETRIPSSEQRPGQDPHYQAKSPRTTLQGE
jgi:hypothetical protein